MHFPKIQDSLSYVSLRLQLFRDDKELSTATGFIYDFGGRNYLITNYHVLSHLDPNTGKYIINEGNFPDKIKFRVPYRIEIESENKDVVGLHWGREISIDLYHDDELCDPVWFVHPKHSEKFDVAAIPIPEINDSLVRYANSKDNDLMDLDVFPSMDCFVLGYPKGMTGGANFPIWKRATIASEPDFDIDFLPKFFIDTATRQGMSGSPVYVVKSGLVVPKGEKDMTKGGFGVGRMFVGIYSGRIGAEDEYAMQLGVVWKLSGLVELLDTISKEAEVSLNIVTHNLPGTASV